MSVYACGLHTKACRFWATGYTGKQLEQTHTFLETGYSLVGQPISLNTVNDKEFVYTWACLIHAFNRSHIIKDSQPCRSLGTSGPSGELLFD